MASRSADHRLIRGEQINRDARCPRLSQVISCYESMQLSPLFRILPPGFRSADARIAYDETRAWKGVNHGYAQVQSFFVPGSERFTSPFPKSTNNWSRVVISAPPAD